MEKLAQDILTRLKQNLSNLKKTPHRRYTKKTILKKQKENADLYQALVDTIKDIDETLQKEIIKKARDLYSNIASILNTRLEYHKRLLPLKLVSKCIATFLGLLKRSKERLKMTEPTFSVLAYTKAIPEFSGNTEDAQKFINLIELFNEEIPENKKQSFFALVYNTKIPDKIKIKLELQTTTDINSLIHNLKDIFKPHKTLNSILDGISNLTQGRKTVCKFAEDIENLISQLNNIQISSLQTAAEKSAVIKSNDTIALNVLKRGLTNANISQTIAASRVNTFKEALQIAQESECTQQTQVMTYRRRNQDNGNRRFNYNTNQRNNNYNIPRQCQNLNMQHQHRAHSNNSYNNNSRHSNGHYYNRNRRQPSARNNNVNQQTFQHNTRNYNNRRQNGNNSRNQINSRYNTFLLNGNEQQRGNLTNPDVQHVEN